MRLQKRLKRRPERRLSHHGTLPEFECRHCIPTLSAKSQNARSSGARAIDASQLQLADRPTEFHLRLEKAKPDVGVTRLARRYHMRDRDFGVNRWKERGKIRANHNMLFRSDESAERHAKAKTTLGDIDHRAFAEFCERDRPTESRTRRQVKRNGHPME